MSKALRLSGALSVLALILVITGCDKLKSRDHINHGIAAFKAAKYADAVEHFKLAIQLDPTNTSPRLYLATSYMQQWIPGAISPENDAMAKAARDEFMKVLETDPNDKTALASLASLSYNEATSLPADKKLEKLNEAEKWNQKIVEIDPKNKEAYYYLGVISWAKWYPQWMITRANLKMKPEDPGPIKDKKIKDQLRDQYASIIDQGTTSLAKALEIDKEFDDAMAYTNLLIREKADLVDSPEEYKKQIEVADGWVQKALDTKKIKQARQPATNGIVADPSK